MRLEEKGFKQHLDFFVVVEYFFQLEDVRRVHPFGFLSCQAVSYRS
jgi:hypothetical protein